jgi:hypothetical protein
MAKGKAKGFKKVSVRIQEPAMQQYYILNEDNQFVIMRDGSGIPVGYYSKLGSAITSVAKRVNAESNDQSVMTLAKFVESYETITNNIINSVKV